MKRSEINAAIRRMEAFAKRFSFALPPFCAWSPDDWQQKSHEFDEIRENMLGWDVTDYGAGDFSKMGFSLVTIRNGNFSKRNVYPKPYAEKLLYIEEGQYSPMHFHWSKMEDIINRGGGNLILQLWNSDGSGGKDATPVVASIDGISRTVEAGGYVSLSPGESICLTQGLYHRFFGEGRVLVGEVSQVNDDHTDNRFFEAVGRFPSIEEDVAPWRLLVSDYADRVQ